VPGRRADPDEETAVPEADFVVKRPGKLPEDRYVGMKAPEDDLR
jgi:hypothetical protein